MPLTLQTAALQAFYWMIFCAMYSFAAVFLRSKDFANQEIGLLLALANIVSVVLQPTIGAYADRATRVSLKTIIALIAIANLALLAGIALNPGSGLLQAALFSTAIALTLTLQPLINALIFAYINAGRAINFGLTRGVGSVAFAVISLLLGLLINQHSAAILPLACIALFLGLLVIVQTLPAAALVRQAGALPVAPSADLFHFLRKYERFALLLLGLACLFIFHTISNTYLVQIITHLGGQPGDVGPALTIAAAFELPVMLAFGYLVRRMHSGTLLKAAGFFYVLRSLLFLSASSVTMIYAAQLLNCLSFALYVPSAVYYVNQLMGNQDKVKGQTLMIGSTTVGSVVGSIAGGWLLDHTTVSMMLLVGSAAAVAGCLFLLFSVRSEKKSFAANQSSEVTGD